MMTSALATLLVAGSLANPKVIWVSPTGDDNGMGSQDSPWRSPEKAVAAANTGDTVRFRGGTYRPRSFMEVTQKGSKDKWLVLEAAPNEKPVFDFSLIKPEKWTWAGGFHLKGASWVRLIGLTILNSHTCGILLEQNCDHIDIVDCTTRMTFMPGIGAWNSTAVRIVGNTVTRANDQDMRLWGSKEQECPHEAISIAGIKGFEAAWNHISDSIKEGIDVKEVSAHGKVHHNLVEGIHRQAYYADAWFGLLEDVEFFSNIGNMCEWGMVVSVEGRNSELKNLRIHHNVFANMRGSGIFFGRWGNDGQRTGIHIHHNTLYKNGRKGHWAGATGNIDLRSPNATDVLVERNLLVQGGAFQMGVFAEPGAQNEALKGENIRAIANFFDGTFAETDEPSPYGPIYSYQGTQAVFGKAKFVDVVKKDFRLAEPIGDFGAFPNGARKLPPAPPTFADFPVYKPKKVLSSLF